ncbi:MAG: NAD(P)-dependent oxidoreductase [Acidimicrobiia bacterium]
MGGVLVTGSAGTVGRVVVRHLEARGFTVRGYDLVDGDDLFDADRLAAATAGCDAVVHSAAIPHDSLGTRDQICRVNVDGTVRVLRAAEAAGVGRVVCISTIQVFGFVEREAIPRYLPIDDDHPRLSMRAYGRSKILTEDLCAQWTERTGVPTVVLRPSRVLNDEQYARFGPSDMELGLHVHADDLAVAVERALVAPVPPHLRATITAGGVFDTRVARDALGWTPSRVLR